ncbi:hypothetical protein ANN_07834 [Periplaneta americana]|uniref:Uncharacterized protein n=1 Tax=Periplaneta americana TaxID=6978 RepID=A0ABQ8SZR2_PERAM|nr:hypothetical protein ANN_07834 [Periplaneta americana]
MAGLCEGGNEPPSSLKAKVINERQLKWFGHVYRMREERKVKQVMGMRVEGRKRRGRPRIKWEDTIERIGQQKGKTMLQVGSEGGGLLQILTLKLRHPELISDASVSRGCRRQIFTSAVQLYHAAKFNTLVFRTHPRTPTITYLPYGVSLFLEKMILFLLVI